MPAPPFRLFTVLLLLGFTTAGCAAPAPRSPASALHTSSLELATTLVGTPYRYGGDSPQAGFDCSGLIYYAYGQNGREVPRTVLGQYRASAPVLPRELRPGDLVFFRTEQRRVSHVGIYLGDGRFVHAPSSGRNVSIGRVDHPYWRKRFIRGGRL